MVHVIALVKFPLNKIAGSLHHSLLTDEIHDVAHDSSTWGLKLYIMGDLINNQVLFPTIS